MGELHGGLPLLAYGLLAAGGALLWFDERPSRRREMEDTRRVHREAHARRTAGAAGDGEQQPGR